MTDFLRLDGTDTVVCENCAENCDVSDAVAYTMANGDTCDECGWGPGNSSERY